MDAATTNRIAAVSQKPLEFVVLQGQPEYDANSLLKEFKREVQRFCDDVIPGFPRVPEHCFGDDAIETIAHFRAAVVGAKAKGGPLPDFPEQQLEAHLENVWSTTGHRPFGHLLQLVHRAKCRRRGDSLDSLNNGYRDNGVKFRSCYFSLSPRQRPFKGSSPRVVGL